MQLVKIWEKEYKYIVPWFVDDKKDREQIDLKKIVVHHTACCTNIVTVWNIETTLSSINENHKARLHQFTNWFWTHIAYHCVVAPDWTKIHTRPRDEYGRHAGDLTFNHESIWLAYLWNWEVVKPSENIYDAMAQIIRQARKNIWQLSIFEHKDVKATACPWKLFDIGLLASKILELEQVVVEQAQIDYKEIYEKEKWNTLVLKKPYLLIEQATKKFIAGDISRIQDMVLAFATMWERNED